MTEHHEQKDTFSEMTNVENMHDRLIPEEFPEGAFGSPIRKQAKVEGKSTPWKKGQQRTSAFVYPDKDQHDDLPRRMPGAHPLHDE